MAAFRAFNTDAATENDRGALGESLVLIVALALVFIYKLKADLQRR